MSHYLQRPSEPDHYADRRCQACPHLISAHEHGACDHFAFCRCTAYVAPAPEPEQPETGDAA